MTRLGVDALVGELLDGRYRVREHLADGGMASVYLGTDTRLERDVAIKVMRPDLAADDAFVSRFRREARSAARLSHPGVVAVHDQGEADGHVFLVMEHVPGRTLREILADEGALTPRAALDLLDPALAGLAAAHTAGLVHRDVKPENVLVREDGAVKVADFGLARAVTSQTATGATGVLLGTVSYLSPEQVERGVADARSDVYAVTLVLYEMLTGHRAVDGETPIQVAFQHVHGELPRLRETDPALPAALDEVIARAAARDPDERPSDAGELRALLAEVRAGLDPHELDRRPSPTGPGASRAGQTTVAHARSSTRAVTRSPAVLGAAAAPPRTGTTAAEPQPLRSRRSPLRRLVPLVLVLLLVAGGGAWWWTVGSMTPVPAVAGTGAASADARLESTGLTPAREDAFDERVAAGTVIRSIPAAGSQVRRGSEVTVVVSKGPERYEVPTLVGTPEQAARARLAATHLRPGTTRREFSEEVPEGRVVSTAPATGTSVRRDARVDLVVSRGREPIPVPAVTGTGLAAATATLEGAGFVVARGSDVHDDDVPAGSVVSQTPARGTGHRGDTVTVVVSKGPVMVEIPDVGGMTSAQAQATLERAGLRVTVERVFGGVLDNVRAVTPGAGRSVREGSSVTIYVV